MSDCFDLDSSNVQVKSKAIRQMFKMNPTDYKWCLPSRIDKYPTAWMISVNGYIIDVREASYELQVEAYEAGCNSIYTRSPIVVISNNSHDYLITKSMIHAL